MGSAVIILKQTIIMFLYMMVGFVLFKGEKITQKGSRDLATLLVWMVIPVVILNSFCVSFSVEKLKELAVSSAIGALSLFISILVAHLLCGKNPIDEFSAAFSNAGFIGIPLISAAFGADAVFYIVGMVAMLNCLQWTYGVSVLTKSKSSIRLKSILLNPIIISTIVGLILFCLGAGDRLPSVITDAIRGISAINAPLAMLVLGVYLAQTDLKSLFISPRLYLLCGIRLLVIPVLFLLAIKLIPGSQVMKHAILIASAAPVGANVAVYSQLHGLDYAYACKSVTLSTLMSVGTLPLIISLATAIL